MADDHPKAYGIGYRKPPGIAASRSASRGIRGGGPRGGLNLTSTLQRAQMKRVKVKNAAAQGECARSTWRSLSRSAGLRLVMGLH